jgi:hypothetical protein
MVKSQTEKPGEVWEPALRYFVNTSFSTRDSILVVPRKARDGDDWLVKPDTLTKEGWTKSYLGADRKVIKDKLDLSKPSACSQLKFIKFTVASGRDYDDFDAVKKLENAEYYELMRVAKLRGMRSIPKNCTDGKVVEQYKSVCRKFRRIASQMVTGELLARVPFSQVASEAAATKRLGLAASKFVQWLRAAAFSCNIGPASVDLHTYRLDSVVEHCPEAVFSRQLFSTFITKLKEKYTCKQQYTSTRTQNVFECGYVFCDGSCVVKLEKRAYWLEVLGGQSGTDGKSRGKTSTDRRAREYPSDTSVAQMVKDLEEIDAHFSRYLGNPDLLIEELRPEEFAAIQADARTDSELIEELLNLSAFGIFTSAGQAMVASATADVLGAERLVEIPALGNEEAIKKKKLQQKLKLEEARAKKIGVVVEKLTKEIAAMGVDDSAVVGPETRCAVKSLNTHLTASGLAVTLSDTDTTFKDLMGQLNKLADSPAEPMLEVKATGSDAKAHLRVKSINNSDGLCMAHALSYSRARAENPEIKDADVKLIEPAGKNLIVGPNGLSFSKLVEHYGLDLAKTAVYLAQDYSGIESGWYWCPPEQADDKLMLSVQPESGLLHAEPIIGIDVPEEANLPDTLEAGNAGEGLVVSTGQSQVPGSAGPPGIVPEFNPQMVDVGGHSKFELSMASLPTTGKGVDTPLGRLIVQLTDPYTTFKETANQYFSKNADDEFLYNNALFPSLALIKPLKTQATEFRAEMGLDRLSMMTPAAMPFLNIDDTVIDTVPMPFKYYVASTDHTFNMMPPLQVADFVVQNGPTKTDLLMKTYQTRTYYQDLQRHITSAHKFIVRTKENANGGGSQVSAVYTILAEIVKREGRPDVNLLSEVLGAVPVIGRADQALQYVTRDGFTHVRTHTGADVVKPTIFPMMQDRTGNMGAYFKTYPVNDFYTDEGRCLPVAVVPDYFALEYLGGEFSGTNGPKNLLKNVLRLVNNQGTGYYAPGGHPIADVEDYLQGTLNQVLRRIPLRDAAGFPVVPNVFIDLAPTTATWQFNGGTGKAPWGSLRIIQQMIPAGVLGDANTTRAAYNSLANTLERDVVPVRDAITRSADGGSGDYPREKRFDMGFSRYELLPEFEQIDDTAYIAISHIDLHSCGEIPARIVSVMPGPMFITEKVVQMRTPVGGFTSYNAENGSMKVDVANLQADVPFMDNLQRMVNDTGKRQVMIIVVGVDGCEFTSSIDWLSHPANVRAPNPRNSRSVGLTGNLRRFCLPIRCVSWQSRTDANPGYFGTSYPANEGPNSTLWNLPQNIVPWLEDNYLNIQKYSFMKAWKKLLTRGVTDLEIKLAMDYAATMIVNQSVLPVVSKQINLRAGHVSGSRQNRQMAVGADQHNQHYCLVPTGTAPNVVADVGGDRADITNFSYNTMNSLGMRAYHTNDGTGCVTELKQFTFGTMRGQVDAALELGYLSNPEKSEWEGLELFEPRTVYSAIVRAGRTMAAALNKVCDWTGKYAPDIMEHAPSPQMNHDDMLKEAFSKNRDIHPHRMAEDYFQRYGVQQFGIQSSQSHINLVNFQVEARRTGDQFQLLRQNLRGQGFHTIPRDANPLYSNSENEEPFTSPMEAERFTPYNGGTAIRWPELEGAHTDKELGALNRVPWKYVVGGVSHNEVNKDLAVYKKDRSETWEIPAILRGVEERIDSLRVMLAPEILTRYGVTTDEHLEHVNDFIRDAGFTSITREYRFHHVIPGTEVEFRVASMNAENIQTAFRSLPQICHLIPRDILQRTDTSAYVADWQATKEGFTF